MRRAHIEDERRQQRTRFARQIFMALGKPASDERGTPRIQLKAAHGNENRIGFSPFG